MAPHNPMFNFTREESDLPPQVPNHLLRHGKQNNKNVRVRSHEDKHRSSMPNTHTNNNGPTSQPGAHRNQHGPHDLLHRPIWNYHSTAYRDASNSKHIPNYEKRLRHKPNERTTINRNDDVQKKIVYNRWNSDSEIQHQQKEKKLNPNNQTRSSVSKHNHHHQDGNLPKDKAFTSTKTATDEFNLKNVPSLDKYEHFIPYTRTDEILDPAHAFSPIPQSREPSASRQRVNVYDDHHRRPNANVQPPPYHVPPAQQQHILQQLTAIKEVRIMFGFI